MSPNRYPLPCFTPMSRAAARVAAMLIWAGFAWAGDAVDLDAILYRATRYGNTEKKRLEKKAARDDLFARGAHGLRAVMERAHFENLMLHVLALEFVTERVPAEKGAPVLAEFLMSEYPRTRRMAAYLLGFYPREDAYVPALIALLDEENQRDAALRTLGKWSVTAVAPRARELLRAARERTRIIACNALREIGGPADINALIDALGDTSLLVRNAAARAIFAQGRAAVGPLRRALEKAEGAPDDARRRQIVRLLTALNALPPRARKKFTRDPVLRSDLVYPGPDIWF